MKLINKKDNTIMFKAEISESLANAVRRYAMQIPILAIDEVEISKNDSALYDETVAHRIGLIVLNTLKSMNSKTEIEMNLNVKKEGNVYAEEFKGDAKVVYGKTPITLLNKGQEMSVKGIARLGRGVEHSKYSPGIIYYRNVFDVSIDKDCVKEVVNVCPKNILKVEGNKVEVSEPELCDMCEACSELCRKQGKDSIKFAPTKELMITVEGFGQISPEEMILQSADILKKDLSEVGKKVK
ncbi:MAG: DNA-directed RNA polymerase subunit D [Candidatus Pacearchaeota archaeon]|jgi:DNA-directed RNA polymerase subunit D